jgi:hypothetical protein
MVGRYREVFTVSKWEDERKADRRPPRKSSESGIIVYDIPIEDFIL